MPDRPAEQPPGSPASALGSGQELVDGHDPAPDEPPCDEECSGPEADPWAGRPPGLENWVPADLADGDPADDPAASEAVAAEAVAAEAIGAGFTHREAVRAGCGTGFAAGGPLDLLAPDPVLAGFADDAVRGGLDALSDDELVGLLGAARRLASWQAATELAAVAELDARRRRAAARPGHFRVSEHVAEELAAALTLTGRAADHLLGVARGLARLPMVRAALSGGLIDRARAEVFAAELSALSDIAAAAVAAALWSPARDMTTGQLRMAVRALVLAIDPDAVRRRAESGRADARVEFWQETSGNGALGGRELPAWEVIAADQRIDQIARSLRAAGAAGSLEELRAAVFTALLLGRDPASAVPPAQSSTPRDADRPAAGRPDDLTEPSMTGPGGAVREGIGASSPAGADWIGGLTGSVHLTMPAAAWLGLSDVPGEAAGFGPLDAATCRGLADLLAAGRARWCMTLTDPRGRALAHACGGKGPGPPGTSFRRGRPGPGNPAGRAGPGAAGGEGGGAGAAGGGRAGPGAGSEGGLAGAAWLASLTVGWLERGDCGHARRSAAYRPGSRLRHLIEIRQRTCCFPGCRRAARRCDLDHTIPYDQGGRTCECGLAPLCRRHHRAKQAPGWQLAQPEPGVLIWRTPSGRAYAVQPDAYPA